MITTAGVLYIVALGLLIVYGVLKIINLAHGAFLALGSYAAVIATWLGWNPWSALVIALAAGVAIGAVAEWRVLRGLYVRPLDTILATWGLNIIRRGVRSCTRRAASYQSRCYQRLVHFSFGHWSPGSINPKSFNTLVLPSAWTWAK